MGMPSSRELAESLDQAFDLVETETSTPDPALLEEVEAEGYDDPLADARKHDEATNPTPASGPPWALWFGLALMIAGLGLAVVDLGGLLPEKYLQQMHAIGLAGGPVFLFGVLLAILAMSQSTAARRAETQLTATLESADEALHATLRQELGDLRQETAQGATNDADRHEVTKLLNKLESMLANLSKAVRLHNKPLVDLVGMAAEHSKSLDESKQALLAIRLDQEAIEKAMTESVTSGEKRFEGLFERLRGSETELSTSLAATRDAMLGRLEPALAELSNRLVSEVATRWEAMQGQLEQLVKDLETRTRDELQGLTEKLDHLDSTARSSTGKAPSSDAIAKAAEKALHKAVQPLLDAVEKLQVKAAAGPAQLSPQEAARTQPAVRAPVPDPERRPLPADPERTGNVFSAIERLKQLRGG
jgi:hypothetical protein